MQEIQESTVVRNAQQGNQNAFGELVSRYQNLVTSIAFSKTGDLQRSEDIAQQAFLIAWQKLKELNEPAKFGAWLRAITRNTVLNSNRKAGLLDRTPKSLDDQDVPQTIGAPDESSSLKEQQQLLWACLKDMPDEYREPLVLYYRQDKSMDQVAAQLGLSVNATKQRLSRGRAMLKQDVHQFVEDILGASKPGPSFSSAVVAAIPLLAGKAMVKGGATIGANIADKAVAKIGLTAPAWSMWAGMYGMIYGLGVASQNVGATIEKNQFYWFSKIATVVSFCSITVAMVPFFIGNESTRHYILVGAGIYAVVLVAMTIFFAIRQRKFDKQNGRVKPKFEVVDLKPATPADFKKAITGATLGSWSWLLFAANFSFDWSTLIVAVLIMWIIKSWRRHQSSAVTTIPAQMKFQAITFGINISVSALIFWVADLLGKPTQILDHPNWQVSLFVLFFGSIIIGSIWRAANKFEMKLHEVDAKKSPRL